MTSGGTTDAAVKSTASELVEDGRAKVNLTLRVVGRRVDGYHDLESVVAFADCADQLSLLPGSELKLNTTGPLAEACGEVNDNLVLKAARLLAERVPDLKTGTFTLYKMLARCGRNRRRFGGCCSRAAAACTGQWSCNRRCAPLRSRAIDRRRRSGLCRFACLRHDRGRRKPACRSTLPKLPCVLVNPRVAVATKDVFAALGLRSGELLVGFADVLQAMVWPEAGASLEEWVEAFAASSNDLEAPAMRIQPVIGEVISALNATDGAWLARMSGSGATCFAIYENTAEAGRAAEKIRRDRPEWWVHAGTLS